MSAQTSAPVDDAPRPRVLCAADAARRLERLTWRGEAVRDVRVERGAVLAIGAGGVRLRGYCVDVYGVPEWMMWSWLARGRVDALERRGDAGIVARW